MSTSGSSPGTTEEVLEGTLESVTYTHPETLFTVAKVRVESSGMEITAVGRLADPHIGQAVRLWGRFVLDPKWGRQFRFERYHVSAPTTLEGVRRYLASGAIPGVREVIAERIVKHFGEQTLEVLDAAPDRLDEVAGLGRKKARQIREAWGKDREKREIAMFLAGQGIGGAIAMKIIEHYGGATQHVVTHEPFRMVREVTGVGFRTADQIAQRMGLSKDSPQRAEAALIYLLEEASRSNGHLFMPRGELTQEASLKLGVPAEAASLAAETLVLDGDVIADGPESSPDLYLPVFHEAERRTAELLAGMGKKPSQINPDAVAGVARAFEEEHKLELDPLQLEGLEQLAKSRLLIITGGPGTGKTTLLRGMIRLFKEHSISTALASPTGRAAKRMEEASGHPARTLHRLLKFDPKFQRFAHDSENPLEFDCVIVDEASMLDMNLAYSLVSALKPETYLVLIGDVDQLPAVGPGSVLRDLIASEVVPTVRLSRVFRQGDKSSIHLNAHRINSGEFPQFQQERSPDGQDFFMLERHEPADAARTIVDLYCYQIPRAYGLDPIRDIQILTPMHRAELGTLNLNQLVQKELGRMRPGQPHSGDRVMQVVNNYDKEVFNGDVGVVTTVDPQRELVEVDFDGRLISYTPAERTQLALAFAISVHKSQGSEYPAVILALSTQHALMLQRNLLYTGMTRARKLVVIVGTRYAVGQAVRNNRIQRRNSKLSEALKRARRESS